MSLILILLFSFIKVSVQAVESDTLISNSQQHQDIKAAFYYQKQAKRSKDPDKALELLKKALTLHSVNPNDNWVAGVRVEMATALFKLGNSKQAFSELLTAEKIYATTKNAISQGDVLSIMARFYEKNAFWKNAEKYYKAALAIHESVENRNESAASALHLADMSLNQNDVIDANNRVSYAIKQYDYLNDKTGLALSYIRLAEIYRRNKQYKKGERLIIESALPFFRSTGYKTGRIGCFDVLGKIYFSQKRYSEAKWFFIQANTQSRELNNVDEIITSLINLGNVKVAIGDYNLAKRDFKEAQTLASDRNNLFLLANVKEAYAELYQKLGDKSSSENAGNLSAGLKDSLNRYYVAQAESLRTARIILAPVLLKEKKANVQLNRSDNLLIVKIIAVTLAILLIIFLILKRIK